MRKTPEERQEYENRLAGAFGRPARQFIRPFGELDVEVPDGSNDVQRSGPVQPENFLAPTKRAQRWDRRTREGRAQSAKNGEI